MLNIPFLSKGGDASSVYCELPIACNNWSPEYASAPPASVRLSYEEGAGLHVRLIAEESGLLATVNTPDGRVCEDSCLEAFIDLSPDSGKGYLNIECNPLAAVHQAIGTGRYGRRFIRDMGLPATRAVATVTDGHWELSYTVSEELISALYGKPLRRGDVIRGNFYICADGKPAPYYATAFPISTPSPDYHRPEFFAEMTVS